MEPGPGLCSEAGGHSRRRSSGDRRALRGAATRGVGLKSAPVIAGEAGVSGAGLIWGSHGKDGRIAAAAAARWDNSRLSVSPYCSCAARPRWRFAARNARGETSAGFTESLALVSWSAGLRLAALHLRLSPFRSDVAPQQVSASGGGGRGFCSGAGILPERVSGRIRSFGHCRRLFVGSVTCAGQTPI